MSPNDKEKEFVSTLHALRLHGRGQKSSLNDPGQPGPFEYSSLRSIDRGYLRRQSLVVP